MTQQPHLDRTSAEAAARRLAEEHFACRADASASMVEGFVFREAQRLRGMKKIEPYKAKIKWRRRKPEPTPVQRPAAEALNDLELMLKASLEKNA